MKKTRKSSKKGFTLVELIVVLVILAILAAMLVPALTGYIKRAREEKDYQTAATVQAAAQAEVTELYGRFTGSKFTSGTLKPSTATYGAQVLVLAGVDQTAVTSFSFDYNNMGLITGGEVVINGSTYTLTNATTTPEWVASK